MLAVTVLLENSRCRPATASTMTNGRSSVGHRRDLTEQHPREPPRGAAVEHREAERQAGDDHHDAAPVDVRLRFLPRQHAGCREETCATPAPRPTGFDRQRREEPERDDHRERRASVRLSRGAAGRARAAAHESSSVLMGSRSISGGNSQRRIRQANGIISSDAGTPRASIARTTRPRPPAA